MAGSVPWIAAFLAWLAVAVVLGVGQALIGGSYASGAIAAVVAAWASCCWSGAASAGSAG